MAIFTLHGTSRWVSVSKIRIHSFSKSTELASGRFWFFVRFYIFCTIFRWLHLLFNLIVQLVVGLPLEMVHGSGRLSLVYMAGVLAGELQRRKTCTENVRN